MTAEFLTYNELEQLFNVQRQTIRLWIRKGSFPPGKKIGGKQIWTRDVIKKTIERGQATTAEINRLVR